MGESGGLRTPLLSREESGKICDYIDLQIEEEEVRENVEWNGEPDLRNGRGGVDTELQSRLEHAISILGESPMLAQRMPIDPFTNKTWAIVGVYDWAKTILLLPVLLVRVLMVVVVLVVGFLATHLALAGYKQNEDPLPRWRRHMMCGTRFCGRAIMFCFGFHWINRTGRPAPREVAPIVVSNHVSFIDPIFFFWELLPILVSSTSHDDLFLVGSIIRALNVIIVDRFSRDSRRKAASEIKKMALNNDYPRVLLFPEATTTNGRALISYKLGAFRPGLAVQPVVVRYPFVYMDSSWGDISVVKLLLRMLTQVTNHMEVEYLPVIYPSKKEVENAEAFAERVRYAMATALNVPETEHTYEDLMLAVKSAELKVYPVTKTMVEMGRMEKVGPFIIMGRLIGCLGVHCMFNFFQLFHVTAKEVKEYLDKFVRMDTTHSGCVTMDQFLEALDLPRSPFSEKIFLMFDKSELGYINFKEFVAALGFLSNHSEFASLIRSSFEGCDIRKDGVLSQLELERSLRSVFPDIPPNQVQQMFEKLDMDQDGVISWEEFRTFLEKNPEFLAVFVAATV